MAGKSEKGFYLEGFEPHWKTDGTLRSQVKRYSKSLLAVCILVCLVLLFKLLGRCSANDVFPNEEAPLTPNEILNGARLIDGHNDWAIWIRAFYNNHIYNDNFTQSSSIFGQVDFPRLEEGKLRGQFWSVYVECPAHADIHNGSDYFEAVSQTLQQIDLVNRLVDRFPTRLLLADNVGAFDAEPLSSGRIAGFLGVEGLHQIGNSAATLRLYYKLGARYVTLTHTCHNIYADSEEPAPLHHGLSEAGKELILEMNRIGLAVDLAHTSVETMRDALNVSKAPVMFSHSGAYGAFAHTRNVPDDVLDSVRGNGGIVMVPFYPAYLTQGGEGAKLEHVVDHILYIRERIGFEHVGIGSDFDGMPGGPEGLEDVSRYPALVQSLIDHGLTRREIEAVIGGSVLRVMRGVEETSRQLADRLPLDDNLPPFFEDGPGAGHHLHYGC